MADHIKIGVLTNLVGPFEIPGHDCIRGAKLAVAEFGGAVAGKTVELKVESSNAIPDSAVSAAGELLNQHQVDLVVGPLSGNEGLALRDFAHMHPEKIFINGSSGPQELTIRRTAPNFFTFSSTGHQWTSGLGVYSYQQGYRKVVTIGEDYSFPYAQMGTFVLEFCRQGGQIIKRHWVPLATRKYRDILHSLPPEADAIVLLLGGTDALHFLAQYQELGITKPIIAGSIAIDQTILSTLAPTSAERFLGLITASSTADDLPDEAWQQFVTAYRAAYPSAFNYPSLFAHAYYLNIKAALLALQAQDGDASNTENLIDTLSKLSFTGPTGTVKLDQHRHAILDNFISIVDKDAEGRLYKRMVRRMEAVNQTLGLPEDDYLAIGSFNREHPGC